MDAQLQALRCAPGRGRCCFCFSPASVSKRIELATSGKTSLLMHNPRREARGGRLVRKDQAFLSSGVAHAGRDPLIVQQRFPATARLRLVVGAVGAVVARSLIGGWRFWSWSARKALEESRGMIVRCAGRRELAGLDRQSAGAMAGDLQHQIPGEG